MGDRVIIKNTETERTVYRDRPSSGGSGGNDGNLFFAALAIFGIIFVTIMGLFAMFGGFLEGPTMVHSMLVTFVRCVCGMGCFAVVVFVFVFMLKNL